MASPVLYLPHGGGPLPLLGHPGHTDLVVFLKEITKELGEPSAILVISAHWEEQQATLTSASKPDLIYDYYGFPEESYEIKYPALGNPQLAHEVFELIQSSGIEARLDEQRGFDHGLFVPLKLMYPEANIPCIQLSLLNNLSAEKHIALGKSLARLRRENVLIIGSGFSFHNLRAFFSPSIGNGNESDEFANWLIETCTSENITAEEREKRLIEWQKAPHARFCHPREEHLLPLHVCYGIASAEKQIAEVVFNQEIMGKRAMGLLWK
jgi:aromatic ring-opening dioxygenase catalytic subunit (LigB family)